MALSVNLENEENSFVVRATIVSDNNNINFYDKMQTDAFRIDIADKFFALVNGGQIKEKLELLNDSELSPIERQTINEEIADFETRIGTPVFSIDKNNFSQYYNNTDEHLLEKGIQICIAEGNTMVLRFAPIQNVPFLDSNIDLSILFCVVGFDFDEFEITNRKAFDVCLLPKLVTGNFEKEIPSEDDPILPDDVERPDYVFNEPDAAIDSNSLYVNDGTLVVEDQKVPVEIIKTSAYTTEYISGMTGFDFAWTTLESSLVDDDAKTSKELPFTVDGESDIENIQPATSTTAKIINDDSITSPNNTLTGVKMYEITQWVKTSGDETYLKDKVKIAVDA